MRAGDDRSGDDEEQALRSFLAGESSAFDRIVRRHEDRVFRIALALLGDREDARDATQEVFLRAFRDLGRWRFESRLSTWLYRMTLNVSREVRRRRWREGLKQSRWRLLAAPLLPREAEASEPEAAGPLARLVQRLPERQREVVLLRVFEDLSVQETAAVLGVPQGTVKSNFFKAIESLRGRLREDGGYRRTEEEPCP